MNIVNSNMNYQTWPSPHVSWKNKSFSQIYSFTQKNQNKNTHTTPKLLMKAQPLKLYRNEIASVTPTTLSQRSNMAIDKLNGPNSSFTTAIPVPPKIGIYLDKTELQYQNNGAQHSNLPSSSAAIVSPSENALRKVRTAGMIAPRTNRTKYSTTYREYLKYRNLTFDQNQYHYLQTGNPGNHPWNHAGSPETLHNVYRAQGVDPHSTDYKPVYYKPSNSKYALQGATDVRDAPS